MSDLDFFTTSLKAIHLKRARCAAVKYACDANLLWLSGLTAFQGDATAMANEEVLGLADATMVCAFICHFGLVENM